MCVFAGQDMPNVSSLVGRTSTLLTEAAEGRAKSVPTYAQTMLASTVTAKATSLRGKKYTGRLSNVVKLCKESAVLAATRPKNGESPGHYRI